LDEELAFRWTYRFEKMHHRLALAGFANINERSDFAGSPPACGRGAGVGSARDPSRLTYSRGLSDLGQPVADGHEGVRDRLVLLGQDG
jgi:hypothetical protein